MSGTSLALFIPYGAPVLRRQALPALTAPEPIRLEPLPRPTAPAPDASRLAAARLYAATQARRCAPVARPSRGRIIGVVG